MMQVGKAAGMVSLNDALMELVSKKLVAPDEAYGKAVDKGGVEMLLKRAGIDPKAITHGQPDPQRDKTPNTDTTDTNGLHGLRPCPSVPVAAVVLLFVSCRSATAMMRSHRLEGSGGRAEVLPWLFAPSERF